MKHRTNSRGIPNKTIFLSYYPLKQGLKQDCLNLWYRTLIFLSYYPLKQGLKLVKQELGMHLINIFILLSIKTRIETSLSLAWIKCYNWIFILLSIKTRIETKQIDRIYHYYGIIFILLSIKTRIETRRVCVFPNVGHNFYPTIH